jgi:lysophospholipase L1-like esterase
MSDVTRSPGVTVGVFSALVHDLNDPNQQGRARLLVPSVFGRVPTKWAPAVLGKDVSSFAKIGDRAWVVFEHGDINRPVWFASVNLPTSSDSVLEGLHARMSTSRTRPVVVAFFGSSTTQGVGATNPADRWVNQVGAALQRTYTSGVAGWEPPVRTLTEAAASVPTVQGVHPVNGGVGGTYSNDFISSTALTQLSTLNPQVVFHMIGSNDHALGTNPVSYGTALEAKIDAIDSNSSEGVLHFLCDTYSRPDVASPLYPWQDYLTIMRNIAARRDNVAFIEQYPEWVEAGVDGYDPADPMRLTKWRVGAGGDIHPSDAGHRLLASMVVKALRLPEPRVTAVPEVFDRFQRAALGSTETAQPWEQQSGVHVPSGGALTVTTGGNAVVTTGFSDCTVAALITHNAAVIPGLIAKSNDVNTRIAAFLNGPSNRVELYVGTTIQAWTTGISLVSGREYHLRLTVQGSQARVELDGVLVISFTLAAGTVTTYSTYTKHGVRCGTANAGVRWRHFEVRSLS